jgi:hypothetical protein
MALTPSIPTAFEGVSFDPPATMYQRVQLMVKNPVDPVFGTGYHRDETQLQVFIVDAPNNGTAAALTRAELTRNWFKKGTTFEEGAFRIHILTTPKVGSTAQIGNRTIIPVLIDVVTEVVSI